MKKSFWKKLADWFSVDFSRAKSFVVWAIGFALVGIGSLINHFDPLYDKYNLDPLYFGNKVIAAGAFLFILIIIVVAIRNMVRDDRAEDAYENRNQH